MSLTDKILTKHIFIYFSGFAILWLFLFKTITKQVDNLPLSFEILSKSTKKKKNWFWLSSSPAQNCPIAINIAIATATAITMAMHLTAVPGGIQKGPQSSFEKTLFLTFFFKGGRRWPLIGRRP